RALRALRLQAVYDDPVVVCGLTLFHGRENPLRFERLALYRVTLPEPVVGEQDRWTVDVDLGVVARTWLPTRFEPESWLSASGAGLRARAALIPRGRYLYAELTARSEWTPWLPGATTRTE